ncbi:MAG: adenylate/guanylate cyclase domain-containing protein [Acidimicrobiales bacterium]|jgi:class 3 adenylate cyclase/tetratricopeptide (TPR) repeat protein
MRVSDLDCYLPRPAVEWDLTSGRKLWRELDASLCFVDISGFTALSERLARRGRVGTEQLTEVLNHVFSRMLAIAALQGGSLLKFGGDALLLLFPGDNHQLCAVRAAVAMRAALRQAQRYQLAAGRLNLRMSVGIHSGTVNLFMVGNSHRELLISGPAASQTVKMEQTAEAGEIVVSQATAGALGPDAVGSAKGAGFLVRTRRVVTDGPGPLPMIPVPREEVALRLPTALRNYLGSVSASSEHRLATVAFLKYTGVDDLLAREGPQAAALVLDETVAIVQAAVDAEKVTFLASDLDDNGGKIILVTGVPTAGDDDEGRMLRALRSIADSPLSLGLQIGVNRGHVFAGEIGAEFRRTFTIMGDTVNLAARLMAAAPKGAILSTAAVLDRSHTLFATEVVPPFKVKGKSAPVQAYAVGAAGGVNPEVRSTLPFVGRKSEIDKLETALWLAEGGTGRVVLVEANRGLGKSRLVDELRARHPDILLLLLQGEPYGQGTPYLPFQRSLRALLGISSDDAQLAAKQLTELVAALGPETGPLAPLLAPLTGLDLADTPESAAISPEFRRDRTADLLLQLYDTFVNRTLLVLVEDAHWFDETTSGLTERLLGAASSRRWLVVVNRRPVPGGLRPAADVIIELQPLADEPAHQLIEAATAAAPLKPHENNVIVTRSGGSPLFLEELVRVARSTGTESLPESLDAVANTDIDTLAPLHRHVLRHASVLGHDFEEELLSEVLENEGLEFGRATRRDLSDYLVSSGPGRLAFRHALLREAAYEGLAYKRRRELHELVGRVIERRAGSGSEAEAGALSLHFSRAQDWDKTWSYARLAGKQAQQVFAPGEVALHLERAVEAARYLPGLEAAELASVWRELGDARLWLGYYRQSDDAYHRAASMVAGDPVAWATYTEKRARVVGEYERRYRSSIRLMHGALARLEGQTGREAEAVIVQLLAREAEIRARQGRFHDALTLSRQAIERGQEIGELRAMARAYMTTDEALIRLGRLGETKHFALALEIFEGLGDRPTVGAALRNLGVVAYFEGRWDDAIALWRRGADVALSSGDIAGSAISELNIGETYANQGRLDEAYATLRRAMRTFQGLGYATFELAAATHLGRVAAELGSDEEALGLLQGAIDVHTSAGGPLAGMEARGFLAETHVLGGRPLEALEVVAAARARGGSALDGTPAGALLDRVEASALAAIGDHAGLVERIDRALPGVRAAGTYFELVVLLILRASLEGGADATELAEERDKLIGQLGVVAVPALGDFPLERPSVALSR